MVAAVDFDDGDDYGDGDGALKDLFVPMSPPSALLCMLLPFPLLLVSILQQRAPTMQKTVRKRKKNVLFADGEGIYLIIN